jgi:hypothetical protein
MAFKLPIEKFGLGTLLPLKGKCLDETKRKWKFVKWIIIDEMSMISYEVLRQIHLRTQQIKELQQIIRVSAKNYYYVFTQKWIFRNETHWTKY